MSKKWKFNQNLKFSCVALCGIISLPFSTYARETEPGLLDIITVTATKSPQKVYEYPGMVTVIDTSDPSIADSAKIKDLLKNVASVDFTGSARRNGQNIVMRGYNTDGLVVLLDRVRQKFESAHEGSFFIDPSIIKTVEIVSGPNSTLYGDGGLGGIISFTTKKATDLLKPGETNGTITTVGYNSVNKEWLVSQTGFLHEGKLDIIANLTRRGSNDIKLSDGTSLPSEDDIVSGLFKANWETTLFSTVRFNLQYLNNNSEEPNNPQSRTNFINPFFTKDSEANLISFGYDYHNPNNNWINLKSLFYYNRIDVDELDPASGRNFVRELNTYGFNIENQNVIKLNSSFKHIFTYGAEYYTEDQSGKDTSKPGGKTGSVPDANSDYWGIFIQDEIELTSRFGKLLMIPGVRLDHYKKSEKDTILSLNERNISPKFGLSYTPVKWLLLFGNYAEGFRAPSMTEVFKTGIHFPGRNGFNRFVPNLNLKPEKNKSFEYGLGMQFEGLIKKGDLLRFKASRFDIKAIDYIDTEVNYIPNPCCGTTTFNNIPKATLHGYDFEGGYENTYAKFTLAYSQITGKNKETNKYLGNITPKKLIANFSWKLPGFASIIGFRGTYAGKHTQVNKPEEVRKSYNIYDFYYEWKRSDKIRVYLGIDNLFNKNYSPVFAGSPAPARNYKIQVSYRW